MTRHDLDFLIQPRLVLRSDTKELGRVLLEVHTSVTKGMVGRKTIVLFYSMEHSAHQWSLLLSTTLNSPAVDDDVSL